MPGKTLTDQLLGNLPMLRDASRAEHNTAWNLAYNSKVRCTSLARREALLTVVDRKFPYHVAVTLDGGDLRVTCDCPPTEGKPNARCAHKLAAVMRLREHLRYNPISTWESALTDILASAPSGTRAGGPRYVLAASLTDRTGSAAFVPYRIPVRHFPEEILENNAALTTYLSENAEARAAAVEMRSAKNPEQFVNAPEATIRAIEMNLAAERYESSYYYYGTSRPTVPFTGMLSLLSGCPLFLETEDSPLGVPLRIAEEPLTAHLALDAADNGLELRLSVAPPEDPALQGETARLDLVHENPLWMLGGRTLFRIDADANTFQTMLAHPVVEIPAEDEEDFLTEYLLPLAERMPVSGSAVSTQTIDAPMEKRLYLSEGSEGIVAALKFGYGDAEVAYEKNPPRSATRLRAGTRTLLRFERDVDAEHEAHDALKSYGLKRGTEEGVMALRKATHPVDFLLRHVPRLAEAGYTVFGEEELATARVNRATPTLSFNVSTGIDWFDVAAVAHFGDLEVSLKDIRRAVRKKERYIKLADGSIGAIPDEWLERYARLFALTEETDEGLRLGNAQVTLLDQMLEDVDGSVVDDEFKRRRDRLRDFSSITQHPLPKGLNAELRPYQKAGFDWLHFLHEYGFGGCLADDMGLGKTLEALAFLLSLKEEGAAEGPSLIVMPRSLLFNWQREAARFTPDLKILMHADTDRVTDLDAMDGYDLVLTTYGVMLRDVDALRKKRFHYVILDEAQAIKNPISKTARAARLLQTDHRLALTGTPVENSTAELWSLFAFLNPGLLGGLDNFRTEFTTPIERHQSTEAADVLRRMVYPFILRRTKGQVAAELPERTERILLTDMEPAQRKLYDKYRDYYRAQVLGLMDEGANNARMKVLEGLLRLRQISNDPRTVDKKYKGGSGKFEALMDTLETLREEGHKALVFSQFTQMLALVRAELDNRGVPYAYLDGRTKDRQTAVDAFQKNEDLPFFLISLKAGGVGLNLTAADYVVHIDPWWNPAVEMQATDRTHRIGQDKPVFIYKLIARDSVEEKILQLQDRKRALVNSLITTDAGFFKSLTRDDVEMLFE